MQMKLPTLSEVVLNANKGWSTGKHYNKIIKYNNFLKQPLKLEMFIPCKDGVPLEIPIGSLDSDNPEELEQYQKAKERVIFKGFEMVTSHNKYVRLRNNDKLETLTFGEKVIRFNGEVIKQISDLCNRVELTESEYKKLGL